MSKLTYDEAVDIVEEVFGEVRKTDDEITSVTSDNKLILLNAKIVTARIDPAIGMGPVLDALEANTDHMNNIVKQLVSSNRKRLIEAIARLKEDKEG